MTNALVPGHYVVFSFDDGVVDDRQLVQILNKYGLKATFFLNGLFDENSPSFQDEAATVFHLSHAELPALYMGHEVGAHTWSHPYLPHLSESDIIKESVQCRDWIQNLFHKNPVGFAYPFGGYDSRIATIIGNLGFKYARTIDQANDFSMSQTPLMLHPSAHIRTANFDELLDRFAATPCNSSQLILHLWGHSYEFTGHNEWDELQRRLAKIKSHEKIKNVLLTDIYR